jgi:hypothetical protein
MGVVGKGAHVHRIPRLWPMTVAVPRSRNQACLTFRVRGYPKGYLNLPSFALREQCASLAFLALACGWGRWCSWVDAGARSREGSCRPMRVRKSMEWRETQPAMALPRAVTRRQRTRAQGTARMPRSTDRRRVSAKTPQRASASRHPRVRVACAGSLPFRSRTAPAQGCDPSSLNARKRRRVVASPKRSTDVSRPGT